MTISIIRKFIFLFIVIFITTSQVHAKAKPYVKYRDLDKRQYANMLDESCKKGMTASCLELGLLYQTFKEKRFRYDGIKYKKVGKALIKKACTDGEIAACNVIKGVEILGGSPLLFYTAIILFGISALIIASMLFMDNASYSAQEKLEDGEDTKKEDLKSYGIVLQYSRPFFKRYLTPVVLGMKNSKEIKEKYKRKLASAGLTDVMNGADFFAFKLFLILGFPVMFVLVRHFIEADWPLKLVPVMAIVGFMYPNIWINGLIEVRQKGIVKGMPFSVDMLALSVEAGLDFIAAMTKVVDKAKPGPLTEEFQILIKEIRIGASRSEALRNMAWRIDMIQISSFCATLIAADSVGASIGPILKNLSVEIRQKKSAMIEKAAATAATKILFPMMAFILPAVFLMVCAPIIVGFITGN